MGRTLGQRRSPGGPLAPAPRHPSPRGPLPRPRRARPRPAGRVRRAARPRPVGRATGRKENHDRHRSAGPAPGPAAPRRPAGPLPDPGAGRVRGPPARPAPPGPLPAARGRPLPGRAPAAAALGGPRAAGRAGGRRPPPQRADRHRRRRPAGRGAAGAPGPAGAVLAPAALPGPGRRRAQRGLAGRPAHHAPPLRALLPPRLRGAARAAARSRLGPPADAGEPGADRADRRAAPVPAVLAARSGLRRRLRPVDRSGAGSGRALRPLRRPGRHPARRGLLRRRRLDQPRARYLPDAGAGQPRHLPGAAGRARACPPGPTRPGTAR